MIKKLLIILLFTNILLADFIRNDNSEVVLDTSTNLLWLDTNGVKVSKIFEESLSFCESLEIEGYKEWRMPNYNELYSIVDLSKKNITIDDNFKNKDSQEYWTSTLSRYSFEQNKTKAWTIHFGNGHDNVTKLDYSSVNIRCVHYGY